jgi:ankyrin repeat protein
MVRAAEGTGAAAARPDVRSPLSTYPESPARAPWTHPAPRRPVPEAPEFLAAIKARDAAAVSRLLDEEPSLAEAREPSGLSAVMLARYFSWSDLAMVDRLVAARGEENLDIFEACATGRTQRVRDLLSSDIGLASRRSPDGFTPLHLAAFFGAELAAELLLIAGADPEAVARNEQRVRPIHSAIAGRSFAITRLLVEAAVDVNAPQQGGLRPLHAAAQNGDELTVDLLLLAGADPALAADDGRTAADLAAAAGHPELASRLLSG